MVSFRKGIFALVVLALFVGLASAQVGTPNTTPPSALGTSLACSATVTVPPQLRAEGITELIGDIVLSCTGGFAPAPGSLVPTANITVSLPVSVTSRLLGTAGVSNASEALLLVDEPGSGLSGPGGPNTGGPALPQVPCGTPAAGAGFSGCTGANSSLGLYFNAATGMASQCAAALTGAGLCTSFGATPNVYQGLVNSNQVTFNGIPVLAPVTSGVSRVFRITNVRTNAAGVGSAGPAGTTPLNASISISGSSSLPINNPVQIAGFIQTGLATSIRSGSNGTFSSSNISLLQCNNQNSSSLTSNGPSVTLRYTENFATAFKTRVAATATTNGLGAPVIAQQNIPGNIYNSESGFIQPSIASSSGVSAGLADFGTRLRAVFTNIPTGVNVFVSTTNLNGGAYANGTFGQNGGPSNFTLGPANTTSIAFLVQTETAADFNGQAPVVTPTTTIAPNTALWQVPLAITSSGNQGEAVWEVVATNPNVSENFDFGVWYQYTAKPGSGSPALGTGVVNMSFAPAPYPPGSAIPSGYTNASSSLTIPRFVDTSTASNVIIISTCQTDLLFPFVTNENGFETGMSIANTSTDPFSTPAQNGSCYIQFYGDNAPATNTTTTAPCTSAGACTGAINSGKVFANTLTGIIGSSTSFQGYAIAVCNFQFAHGFAFISDTHATNLAMGYLAIVLNNGVILTTRGNSTTVPAAEGLAH
jgi:hypothetical protein